MPNNALRGAADAAPLSLGVTPRYHPKELMNWAALSAVAETIGGAWSHPTLIAPVDTAFSAPSWHCAGSFSRRGVGGGVTM